MYRVEQHIVKRGDSRYLGIDHVCWLSKNLYNAGLYVIKQEFLRSGRWMRWVELNKAMVSSNNPDYRALSAASSNIVLHKLDFSLKSYFGSIKAWKRDNKKFTGCPKFPRYKDKEHGRNVFVYTYQQLGWRDGSITFPKKEGFAPLRTRFTRDQIKEVRFVPRPDYYVIEVVGKEPDVPSMSDNGRYMALDLGVNNLAACATNVFNTVWLVNGRPLKSINQYYNKRRASIQSELERVNGRKTSHRLSRLTLRRNNKVKDYLHKASRRIVDFCAENNINTLIVGYNDGWKQEVNMGRRNNQAFVGLPFDFFVSMLAYKSARRGLRFLRVEESYTSKCSSVDLEAVCKHDVYVGKRVKRGLFRCGDGSVINADVNGSYNIMRKASRDVAVPPAGRGCGRHPVCVNADEYLCV